MIRKISIALIACAFVVGCKGKQTQSDQPVETGLTNNSVDSTPLGFDPSGSDSGKIDGLSSINFGYDKANLDSEAKRLLAANAEWIKARAGVKVQVEGHCDQRGTIEYNVALGERRANSVKAYLVSLGVKADRLSTISYGKEKPLDASDSETAMAKNRRANFVPAQ
jgi:peptidoglycan-associated lipoprotein